MDYDYPTLYGCDCCGERFAADTLTKHFENLQKSGELLNHLVPAAARALFGDKNPKRRATPRKTMQ